MSLFLATKGVISNPLSLVSVIVGEPRIIIEEIVVEKPDTDQDLFKPELKITYVRG
jgi:hypothetical protein